MVARTRLLDRGERGIGVEVAASGAVLQFADGVVDAGRIDLLVLVDLVVIGMAGGTIGAVGRCLEGNHFVVVAMAVVAVDARAMCPISDRDM